MEANRDDRSPRQARKTTSLHLKALAAAALTVMLAAALSGCLGGSGADDALQPESGKSSHDPAPADVDDESAGEHHTQNHGDPTTHQDEENDADEGDGSGDSEQDVPNDQGQQDEEEDDPSEQKGCETSQTESVRNGTAAEARYEAACQLEESISNVTSNKEEALRAANETIEAAQSETNTTAGQAEREIDNRTNDAKLAIKKLWVYLNATATQVNETAHNELHFLDKKVDQLLEDPQDADEEANQEVDATPSTLWWVYDQRPKTDNGR